LRLGGKTKWQQKNKNNKIPFFNSFYNARERGGEGERERGREGERGSIFQKTH